jgi:hypothetical protein
MKLYSSHAASEILEKDRQTLTRALRGVRPDAMENHQPRYRMQTILDAMAMHQGTASRDGLDRETHDLIHDLEICFEQFDAGLARCTAEPDIDKRRALESVLKVGPLIGEMERLLKKGNASGDIAITMLNDYILYQSIGKFCEMMDWQVVPDETAA